MQDMDTIAGRMAAITATTGDWLTATELIITMDVREPDGKWSGPDKK